MPFLYSRLIKLLATSVFCVAFSILGYGQDLVAKVVNHKICNYQNEYRSIRVQNLGPNQCETIYTKKGKDLRLGRGVFLKSCEKIYLNIEKNLVDAKWTCKNAFGSQFLVEPLEG